MSCATCSGGRRSRSCARYAPAFPATGQTTAPSTGLPESSPELPLHALDIPQCPVDRLHPVSHVKFEEQVVNVRLHRMRAHVERACNVFFFFNDTATTEIYTLSLHDALPISPSVRRGARCASSGSASM